MKKSKGPGIVIPAPKFRVLRVGLVGLSPLMMNRFSEKARNAMAAKQAQTEATAKRPPKIPMECFTAAAYLHPEGGYGFPAASFRLAAVSACRLIDGLPMTVARQLFVVLGNLVKITGKPKKAHECAGEACPAFGTPESNGCWPHMDVRGARNDNGGLDLRYRPIFWPWECELEIRYDADATTPEQVGHLLLRAGEQVGVGELRPEKGGNYGRFALKT